VLTDSDSELLNKSNSTLLRLPGELRNQIYRYLFPNCKAEIVVDELNLGQYPWTYTKVGFLVYGYGDVRHVSRQLDRELFWYLLDHSSFSVAWWHLEGFVQHLEAAYLNRIKSLVIDVSDRMTNGIENDAEFIADYLRPLCRSGRLQNIKVQTRGCLLQDLIEPANR
jgi:hypothetical protein